MELLKKIFSILLDKIYNNFCLKTPCNLQIVYQIEPIFKLYDLKATDQQLNFKASI